LSPVKRLQCLLHGEKKLRRMYDGYVVDPPAVGGDQMRSCRAEIAEGKERRQQRVRRSESGQWWPLTNGTAKFG
jgi:hypothetical protein